MSSAVFTSASSAGVVNPLLPLQHPPAPRNKANKENGKGRKQASTEVTGSIPSALYRIPGEALQPRGVLARAGEGRSLRRPPRHARLFPVDSNWQSLPCRVVRNRWTLYDRIPGHPPRRTPQHHRDQPFRSACQRHPETIKMSTALQRARERPRNPRPHASSLDDRTKATLTRSSWEQQRHRQCTC